MSIDPNPDERGERPETGVAAVDEVLRAVDDLDDQPVEEHVAVLEVAHSRLRQALDNPGD